MPSPMAERGAPSATVLGGSAATGALNLAWAETFVAALAEGGVRDACVCSGSRSAPLALAFDRSPIRTHVPLDERSGAFFALGLAKASRRPVAIVCTSGTAAANFHPAILEAYHGRVPLIVLTADRPPELRDTGAAQTIDQIKLFGTAVRWFCEVATPSPEPELERYVASLGRRAVSAAWGAPAGPVHLNFPFREPLLPDPDELRARGEAAPVLDEGAPKSPPPSPRSVSRAARLLRAKRRGLLICGPDDAAPGFADAVARLAAVTGYPILADPASQVRYGPHDRTRVLGGYDAFLRSPAFAAREKPEIVLQFGAAPTSKSLQLYAANHSDTLHLIVDPAGEWRDPSRRSRESIVSDPAEFAVALAVALEKSADPLPAWADAFDRAERAARETLERARSRVPEGSSGWLFADLLDWLPDGAILYIGNSMAIRDLDFYAPASRRSVRVLSSRGVNGIDGVLSSALGAGAADAGPVVLVTGDLSFLHDVNGLAAAREGHARATIVVVNDDGGGIFSYLPVSRHGDAFERYFATPHGFDLSHAAALYGLPFSRPSDREEFRTRASRSIARQESEILEVRCDRAANRSCHQSLRAEIVSAVEAAG